MSAAAEATEEVGIVRLSSAQGYWIIAATALGSGMVFLDSTVVNVALPRVQTDLGATLAGMQWIVNGYLLSLAALLLVGGDLGDIYGRRLIFSVGLAVFSIASVACGLAPNLEMLIVARIVQGVGGALLVPGSLAMIKAVMVPEDAGRAIGMWAGLSGVTTAIGPLVGGYLVDAVSWRAIFFINVPVAALTLFATLVHVPENRDPKAWHALDLSGALTTVLGLGGLTYGLIEGPALGWRSWQVVASLLVGVAGMVAFPLWEARIRHPMVPLGIFRSRNFTGANLATLGVYFAFTGLFLFLILDLQQVQGYSPLQAGAAGLPITFLLLVLSPRVGGLMNRFGARIFMTAGALIIALSMLLFITVNRSVNYPFHLLPMITLAGLGMSLFVTPLTTTVMASVPTSLAGVASGINNAVSRIASLLAVAVLGVIVAVRFDATLHDTVRHASLPAPAAAQILAHSDRLGADPVPASLHGRERAAARDAIETAFSDGFHWAVGFCALLCLVVAVLSWLLIRPEQP